MKDLLPVLGGALAALLGGILGLFANWFTQRAAHKREQLAERKAKLLDAYADWAALLSRQYHRLIFAAARADLQGLSPVELEDRRVELSRLWDEIRDADVSLKRTTYRLQFLEATEARRQTVKRITDSVTLLYDTYPEWSVFEQQVRASSADLTTPYQEELEGLLRELQAARAFE